MAIKQKKLFKFADGKTSVLKPKERSLRAGKIKNYEDKPPFFVRGQLADSKEEFWVSLALEKIEAETGWSWDYQVPVYGGRNISHGNVIDFLVHTPGRWTMLDPKGKYWHTGIHEDQGQMRNVARRKRWRLIEWFTDETPTREAVYVFLRRELNV